MTNHPFRRPGVTRRQFLGRSGLALGGLAFMPSVLTACGGDDDESSGSVEQDTKSLYFANWPAYLDEETVGLFEQASGISMRYTEEFNDNYEYFAKIQPQLGSGKRIEPDLLAPTSWMAGRLISLGWVEKLPLDKIPNAANLEDGFKNPTWDPTGEYSLPWQAGVTGIAYNKKVTGRDIKSVADLWDPAFKSKVSVLTEWRDTLGIVGMSLGIDITNPTADSLMPIIEELDKHVQSGQIGAFTGNDYLDDLSTGNLGVCLAWSGDIAQLKVDNPDVEFVIPESGGTLWADTMVIPKGSDGIEAAAKWIDFVYDPENAARIAKYVQFISPVKGVKDVLLAEGGESAELANNPLMFPSDEDYENLKSFGLLSEDDEATIDAAFSKLQGN